VSRSRSFSSTTRKKLFATVKAARTPYIQSYEHALTTLLAGNQREAARTLMMEDVRPKLTVYHDAWSAFDKHEAAEIDRIIAQSQADYATGKQEFLLTVALAGAITCAIAAFTVLRLGREVAIRQRAEESLRKAYDDLDQRIQERTSDLDKANKALEAEKNEHKRISEQLDRIFALTPDIIFTKGFDGYLKQFNPALEKILGYTKAELLAEPFLDFAHPTERMAVTKSLNRSLENQEISGVESRCRCKDGSYKWIQWNAVAVPRERIFTGTGRDITERKLAEERLESLRTEQKAILDSVGMGVHCIDMEGHITYENPTAAKLLGYDAEDLIGKPAHGTIHHTRPDGSHYPVGQCPIYATLRDGKRRRITDEVFWRKNGTSFPVEYTSTAIRDEEGKITGAAVVFTDLTERLRIEARLVQSQKMKTVGRLAGGVAHEFNSILTAIIGQSELLLSDLPADNPMTTSAREIRRAADRAAVLTRQLLAYGRKQILQPEMINLNRVLSEMLGTLQHVMGREIDVRIVPVIGLKLANIDPGQMEQVIVNIAMNAADAMQNGGAFTLETANVTLDEDYVRPFRGLKSGEYVMLAMSDTGMGMTPDVKTRVFEPFFSTKGVGQGTGLGLATCYGIIKQSEGHLSVYSEPGRGTTFRVYLPQVDGPAATPLPQHKTLDLPRGTETILLAEDDPSLLEMAANLLRRQGYTVFTAVNGLEALSLKNQRDIGHIDLLLTDIVMPHMSGKELADRILAIYPHTRILFTSAFTENAAIRQGIFKSGVKVLQKPFTPSALASKVREVLDQPLPAP
jgi:two-component system cell cycle sensor histidine kinase/response regulator CckA